MKHLMAALFLLIALPAFAGQSCEEQDPTPDSLRKSFELGLATRKALDDSGAQVVILARSGQDLSKYGLSWSHAGLIWRDHPAGRWIAVHLLNDCGSDQSALYNEGLANFFADTPLRWEGLVIIPDAEMQSKLSAALASDIPVRLHKPAYNMVAYPFSTRYQNSNQWVLELIAASTSGTENREQAQHWLLANGYHPSQLKISALTRLGGRMFRANVAFDDHPSAQRWADRIDTVTVESIEAFLLARGAKRLRVGL
ncbi:MAG: DUF2145 domain-containing protein [Burkholderiaceae bacterium]|nr:DUF2145 domain-containing protein [Burkholderiaceae bacterium]MCF8184178.1 DUF2145 domain-containing protein [Polynucleobacter sp.]